MSVPRMTAPSPAHVGCVPGCTDTEDGHRCTVTFGVAAARTEHHRVPVGLRVEVVQEHEGRPRYVALMVDNGYGDALMVDDVPGLVAALTTVRTALH